MKILPILRFSNGTSVWFGLLLGALTLTLFGGCTEAAISASDHPDPVIGKRDHTPCNPNATKETRAVLRYISALSEGSMPGVVVGQNCGHAGTMFIDDSIMSYQRLVKGLHEKTGKWVGIVSVDYEHNKTFTSDEIKRANQVLIDYWNKGGLVAVGLSPQNPWLNDESNLENHPGEWTYTRTNNLSREQLEQIDLNKLIDPKEPIHQVWRRKLDRIADGLLELQEAGVVVLFKPMQEQNGGWFWWGTKSHPNDPIPYVNLYRDMVEYFTYERKLNNILWLYSPNRNSRSTIGIKDQLWLYPGDDFVDIVALTTYNDEGNVYDYEACLETGKPLGMAEMGPHHDDNKGQFDNRTIINRLNEDYPAMAFWISWEDWENGDGTNTYMSITGNQYSNELMNHANVITREALTWQQFLE